MTRKRNDEAIAIERRHAQTIDSNVEAVREKLRQRAEQGLRKYGVTTERTDLRGVEWLQHLQEELMDACVYIERAMKEFPNEPGL